MAWHGPGSWASSGAQQRKDPYLNQAPPRKPNELYQAERQIGTVETAVANDDNGVTVSNVRITQQVDLTSDFEIQNLVVRCPELFERLAVAQRKRSVHFSGIFIGTYKFVVVGTRR